MQKTLIWTGMLVGSTIGGLLPALWGGGLFSLWAILLSAVGAVVGVWAGFKLGQDL